MNKIENPFAQDDVKQAVNTLHRINYMELDGINPYDLLTAVEALDMQYPMTAIVTHKTGEEAALIECNSCGLRIIANYELYEENHREWYCKRCGQRCVLPERKEKENGRDK